MAKLRGTEAEIHARLRELTQRLRQIRKEFIEGSGLRLDARLNLGERSRPPTRNGRSPKPKRS